MLTREQIIHAEQIVNRQIHAINEACEKRDLDKESFEKWSEACDEFHRTELATDFLWSDETRMKIRNGDWEAIEDTLLFLEVDPWYFRSGYMKEFLLDVFSSIEKGPTLLKQMGTTWYK